MQYQVPQFIEVEDKVIGPLTVKQFIYLAGTGGLCVVFVLYLPVALAVLFALPLIALGVSLAFYKVNGKPFIEVLEAGFNYYTGAKFFLWKHKDTPLVTLTPAAKAAADAETAAALAKTRTPKLTRGKLSELALSLDMKPGAPEDKPLLIQGSTTLSA
jgi:hypothetical protein